MVWLRRERSVDWPREHHDLVRSALAKLDPWSYRVAVMDPSIGAEYAAVGSTGAFVIAIYGVEGYVEPKGAGVTIDGLPLQGVRRVAKAAKAAKGLLLDKHVFADVVPILCLTKAAAGVSRSVSGVRVVRLVDLVNEISGRPRALEPDSAKKGAAVLGTVLPTVAGPRSEEEDG
jgi:hypothetical protein